MKKAVSILIIILFLVGICTYEAVYKSRAFNKIETKAAALHAGFKAEGLNDATKAKGNELVKYFTKNKPQVLSFNHYLEIEDITNQISLIDSKIKNNSDTDFDVEVSKLILLIKTYKQLYKFSISNIL